MAVLRFAPEGADADLAAAGARLFRDMVELPGLLGLRLCRGLKSRSVDAPTARVPTDHVCFTPNGRNWRTIIGNSARDLGRKRGE